RPTHFHGNLVRNCGPQPPDVPRPRADACRQGRRICWHAQFRIGPRASNFQAMRKSSTGWPMRGGSNSNMTRLGDVDAKELGRHPTSDFDNIVAVARQSDVRGAKISRWSGRSTDRQGSAPGYCEEVWRHVRVSAELLVQIAWLAFSHARSALLC